MAINLNDNIKVLAGKPTDARYLNNLTPYATVLEANTAIGSTLRYIGLTVNIAGVEYWYGTGILDTDLVIKDSGIANTGLTNASNGLSKVGDTVILGGTLSGATTLTAGSAGALLQYGGDYSANYVARTIVDAGYVTGKTSVKLNTTVFNTYTGDTQTMYNDVGDPTGFINNQNIVVSYNSTNRTITLSATTGTIDYYWRGDKKTLGASWTSAAHTNNTSAWYLYSSDGTNFAWSTAVWDFDDVQVAARPANTTWAIREIHGTMGWETHQELHRTIGTYRVSGFGLTPGTFVLQPVSPTDADNTPGFDAGTVADEDLQTSLVAWTEGSYSQLHFTSTGTVNLATAQSNIFRVGSTYPKINPWNGTAFTETETTSGQYFNYYVIRIPVTADVNSQDYRAVVLQPQYQYGSLDAAQAESPLAINLGNFTNLSPEYVFIERITLSTDSGYTSTGKVRIEAWSILTGAKFNQTSTTPGAGSVTAGNVSVTPLSPFTETNMQTLSDAYATCLNALDVISDLSVTGATNGLSKVGRQVKLGGSLTGDTTICGGDSYQLNLGGASLGQRLDDMYINALGTFLVDANGISMQSQTFIYTDCGAIKDGITYGANYASGFTARSLVDAEWVTGKTSTSGIQTANNGLNKAGTNVRLGGNLTGNTLIGTNNAYSLTIACNNIYGLQVKSNGYVVLGDTSCTLGHIGVNNTGGICLNACTQPIQITANNTGFVNICAPYTWLRSLAGGCLEMSSTCNIFFDANSKGIVYDGNYSPNFTARSLVDAAYVTGLTNSLDVRLDTIEADYVTGGTNGLSSANAHELKLGGTLTENTCIAGSYIFTLNTTTNIITGATTCIGGTTYLKSSPAGSGGLLCRDAVTGQICQTSLASFGGITGATNGLTDCGSQRIGLGGALCADTAICGAGQDLSIGTAGSKLDLLGVHTSGDITVNSDKNLNLSLSGGTIATSDLKGLRYTTDYSDTFVDNSLVSKLYVDTVATGLDPKSAVLVATTGNITLSGTQTIDGVALVAGDRVLVKNQTSGATNGIYVVTASTWTRATDFDGAPTGEVSEGALIPVLSGSTNINSSWILITKNPITVGVTPLVFTKFSQLLDVSAGNGIEIQTVGYTKQISVDLASTSGLEFSGTELRVDLADNSGLQLLSTGLTVNPGIAGNALDWTDGVIDVNIADINSQLGGVLSGATNGLTDSNGVVCLGGALSTSTSITVASDACPLTFVDSAASKRGICYGGDYSADFVDRSLVTKYFVNNAITGGTGISNANNGLTKVGNTVVLGGSLTGNTEIDVCEHMFEIVGAPSIPFISINDIVQSASTITVGGRGRTILCGPTIDIGNYGASTGITVQSTKVVDLMSCTNGISGAQAYLNGNIGTISLSTSGTEDDILISTSAGPYIELNGTPNSGDPYAVIGSGSGSAIDFAAGAFNLGFTTGTVTDNNSPANGLVYASDTYRDTFIDTSLVDKGYVDAAIIASGASTIGASNGLTRVDNNITLGGTLTGDTTINTNGYDFTICDIDGSVARLLIEDTNRSILQSIDGASILTLASGPGNGYALLSGSTTCIYGDNDVQINSVSNICLNVNGGCQYLTLSDGVNMDCVSFGTTTTFFQLQGASHTGGECVELATTNMGLYILESTPKLCLCTTTTPNEILLDVNGIALNATTGVYLGGTNLGQVFITNTPNVGDTSSDDIILRSSTGELKTVGVATITGATAFSFTNGLCLGATPNTVCLGGVLTEALTVIDAGALNEISICNASFYGFNVNSTRAILGDISTTAGHVYVDTSDVKICGQATNVCLSSSACIEGLAPDITVGTAVDGYGLNYTSAVLSLGDLSSYPAPPNSVIYVGSDFINILSINGGCLCLGTSTNTFADENTCVGLQYLNDYSTNGGGNPRWIPDAQWVTGLTTQGITAADNGLTKSGNVAILGGTLTGVTTINTNDNPLTILDTNLFGLDIQICEASLGDYNDNSNHYMVVTDAYVDAYQYDGNNDAGFTLYGCGSANLNASTTTFNGSVDINGGDNNLVTLSANISSNVTTVTLDSEIIRLYTSLGACMTVDGSSDTICAYTTQAGLLLDGADDSGNLHSSGANVIVSGGTVCLGGTIKITDPASGTIDDSVLVKTTAGEVRTISVADITGATTISAINGLNNTGAVIGLGGILTGNTNVNADAYDLKFSATTGSISMSTTTTEYPVTFDMCQYSLTLKALRDVNGRCASVQLDKDCAAARIYANGGEIDLRSTAVSAVGGTISIYAESGTTICGAVTLFTAPQAGSTSDAVLVRDSGTGEIKTVPQSSLGDKNNIYAMQVITSNTLLTSGCTYVQLVNSPSATVTVCLPASPDIFDGQVFRIKDAAGTALSYNISVDGNGNCIDGGSNPAVINTDGGALELVWNETLSSWYVFSFVN